MVKTTHPVECALRSGSRAKYYAKKIRTLCKSLPPDVSLIDDKLREEILSLAAVCRASKEVANALSIEELPSIEEIPEFHDLFCETYYPVLEDGKRTVGFWSIKDSATLTPDDVHEWVRDRQIDKQTKKPVVVPVPFGTWWRSHRPDYELYRVASDSAEWCHKVIEVDSRKAVNTLYGKPPVRLSIPKKYGDGKDALTLLNALLERTITDKDEERAKAKRVGFVLDAGAHLLALRDFGDFRCRKLFCFTSTNGGQGTGKSLLHESIAALVPRDFSCTVPTTALAGDNLLPLYMASVCILTEAPSTSSERYTAEDVKSFADAGWKTAKEKYIANRPVRDNALKLLSSNHLSPLPVDSPLSRRFEFFIAKNTNDGGNDLRKMVDEIQVRNNWSVNDVRVCVGWALLTTAQHLLDRGDVPCAVARRTIDAAHLLSVADYEYFVIQNGNCAPSYSAYKDFRSDKGFTWSPDYYRFEANAEMSKSKEDWLEGLEPPADFASPEDLPPEPPESPKQPPTTKKAIKKETKTVITKTETKTGEEEGNPPSSTLSPEIEGLQYKTRVAKARLEEELISLEDVYNLIVDDQELKEKTEGVRNGTEDKKMVLPQMFPGAYFDKFTRRENIVGFTRLVHVDFDHISEQGSGLKPEQVRDVLSGLDGFVIGAVSSSNDGVWAIFNAGEQVKDAETYACAERALFEITEEATCLKCDKNLIRPTIGRALCHDPDCKIAPCCLEEKTLPTPFKWKAPTFAVANIRLSPSIPPRDMTIEERVRQERFMEAVVENSCSKVLLARDGDKHNAAIRAAANIMICCRERGLQPLPSWGRRLRDACLSCGLPPAEVKGIMQYWKEKTGVAI